MENSGRYLIPGRDGEIREVTAAELAIIDAELKVTYTGKREASRTLGKVVVEGGTNPPFDTSELDQNIRTIN